MLSEVSVGPGLFPGEATEIAPASSGLSCRSCTATDFPEERIGNSKTTPALNEQIGVAGKRQRQPRPGATCLRIASTAWAL